MLVIMTDAKERVAVAGAGLMGTGIAHAFATSGYRVALFDIDAAACTRARAAIASRLYRLAYGHAGDVAPVGEGVSELRIHHGPGYRIYFHQRGKTMILLLCGGDKGSQAKDIKLAKRLLRALE